MREVHRAKASMPIEVTEVGMVIEVSLEQDLKA